VSARDVIASTLTRHAAHGITKDARDKTGRVLVNLRNAGYVLLPAEMTEEQARRSLAGNRLADRLRDVDPEHFARLVEARRATWRQMVKVMGEGGGDA